MGTGVHACPSTSAACVHACQGTGVRACQSTSAACACAQALLRIDQLEGQALTGTILAARHMYVRSNTRAVLPLVFDIVPAAQVLRAAAQQLLSARPSSTAAPFPPAAAAAAPTTVTAAGAPGSDSMGGGCIGGAGLGDGSTLCAVAESATPLDLEGQMQQLVAALLLRALASAKEHVEPCYAAAPARLSRWMEPLKQVTSALKAMDLQPLSQPQVCVCVCKHVHVFMHVDMCACM